MTIGRAAGVVVLCAAATTATGAQSAEDAAWTHFLAWLRTAPAVSGPGEIIQAYQMAVTASSAAPSDAERRMATVLRLMRERTDAWPLIFDKIYASPTPNFSTRINALLAAAVEGRQPGKALDVGMGQGRNAVALAVKGWEVTGFDVSAEGLAVAKAQAARANVPLEAVLETDANFDYGVARWDLVAVIYGPGSIADPAFVAKLHRALRPGGLVVVESFASDKAAVRRKPVDIDPGELLRAFAAYRILRFEDTDGISDWDPQTTSLVRLIAQKKQ